MSTSVRVASGRERAHGTDPAPKSNHPHKGRTDGGRDIRAAGNLSVQRASRTGSLQRCAGHKCPPSGCSPERKRLVEGAASFGGVPDEVIDVLDGPGRPLDARMRTIMESVFRRDLRDVRIHSDAAAAGSTDAVGALAYTVGSDVVLGHGYTDRRADGAEILGHELAHVLQQRRGSPGASLAIDDDPTLETEARAWAGRAKEAVTRLSHAGALVAGHAEHRCARGQSCPAEELVDHQGQGTTTCDRASGRMNVVVTEHCAGDCVALHENVHVGDRQECCTRVSTCLTSAAGDPAREAACHAAYSTWHPQLSDWTECRAYTTEVGCLTRFIAANCNGRERATTGAVIGGFLGAVAGGIGGFLLGGPVGAVAGAAIGGGLGAAVGYALGSVSEDCCNTLRTELAFAQGEAASRCPGVQQPCPFRADGSII